MSRRARAAVAIAFLHSGEARGVSVARSARVAVRGASSVASRCSRGFTPFTRQLIIRLQSTHARSAPSKLPRKTKLFLRWRCLHSHNTWVFSGSDARATRMMMAASLSATRRKRGLDPWWYLCAVFAAIAEGLTARQLADDWTPWAWAQKQAQQPNAQATLAVAS